MDERTAYIALNMMDGVGPVTVRAMSAGLGSVQAIFQATSAELKQCHGIGSGFADKILQQRDSVDPDAEEEKVRALGAQIVTSVDEQYPDCLREIHDPPLALYVLGSIKKKDKSTIAVVGSRRATHYGRDCAERLSYQLAQAGFVVASGLALGIDTSAHRGALKARGRTIAVLGSALDCIYPELAANDRCDLKQAFGGW